MTEDVVIRPFGPDDAISEITSLLHTAYAPLAAAGMKFVATWQDDEITARRMERGTTYVAYEGETLVGTITCNHVEHTSGCVWYDRDDVASFGQFAVMPERQGEGIGTRLIGLVEREASRQGVRYMALDTAETAEMLILFYRRLGYKVVGHTQWNETNYRSVIMRKRLEID